MDQCASTLLAFPPTLANVILNKESYHEAASVHTQRLAKLLKEHTRDLVAYSYELFQVVHPTVNSISYLVLLHALMFPSFASSVPSEFIQEKIVTFMMLFDGHQSRYGGTLLLDLLEAVGSGRILPPSVAVDCLAAAILKLDPSGTILTSSHLALAKLAYETNNIQAAIPVIDKDIVFYPGMANEVAVHLCDPELPPFMYISRVTGLTANVKSAAVLEYDLLCGMIYCSRREWKKARAALERAVSFPTKETGCSKIMVDAFKKWVLVGLLSEGKYLVPQASSSTAKTFGVLGGPYIALAMAFASDDVSELRSEAERNMPVWLEDGNVGLVEEVIASYQPWRVLSLQDIYTKISIPEIREQTKSAETGAPLNKDEDVESLIQNMIIEGMLKGVIEKNDDGTKFLVFLSSTTNLSEQEFAEEIQRAADRLKELKQVFVTTNQRLGTSREYIRWAVKETKRDKSGDAQDPTLGFEAQIDDEDLMSGLPSI
ncbi:hypothetical protein ONZ43_g1172 [Nemania bipapillata]|uniref:Uncharacterized protein n=1 Tax=Nemania bipapillata TaxID=110536 RepID=A0ACC2J5S6_9PEZI|nr:hypothetical protein ONZ43_g1172 [Nemania bipapillata]